MFLLGTAGGVGPAMDSICICPELLTTFGTFVAAYLALITHSTRAVVIAGMLTGFAGIVTLVALATFKPSIDPDEDSAEVAWNMFRWWAISAVVTGLVAVRVVSNEASFAKVTGRYSGSDIAGR